VKFLCSLSPFISVVDDVPRAAFRSYSTVLTRPTAKHPVAIMSLVWSYKISIPRYDG
jgi:hypothetical protein